VPSDAAVIARPLDDLHVLAVEDVDDSRDMLVALLSIHGARVTAVACACEALAVLDRATRAFDVLVSDIQMPEETGYDLIRSIRKRSAEQGGDIPAIALTSLSMPDDRAAIRAAGFQAHLEKPVESDDLVRVIRAVTGAA
jgi:two-component system, chemotaxis family, CheB/CheR fusion protein